MLLKLCPQCEFPKNINEFNKCKSKKDGHVSLCREHTKIAQQKYYYDGGGQKINSIKSNNNKMFNRNKILFSSAQSRAKKNNLPFNIELSDIIIPEYCPVFNTKIKLDTNMNDKFCAPSIDRIDSDKGYTKDNIIITSYKVNWIKNNASLDQIKILHENWFNIANRFTLYGFEYSIRKLIENAKTRSRINNLEYSLIKPHLKMPITCPIFGLKLKPGKGHFQNQSPSLDRIDNTKGYVQNNVRIISWLANKLKGMASYEEYTKIYNFYSQYM